MTPDDIRMMVTPYLEKLAGLETSQQIADFLIHESIKARRNEPTSCAIAEYVWRNTGQEVTVDGDDVSCEHPQGETSKVRYESTLKSQNALISTVVTIAEEYKVISFRRHTDAMIDFIENFDEGMYPELVK